MREGYERSYSFGPPEQLGLLGGLRTAQVAMLGAACTVAVLLARAFSGGGLVPAAAILGVACFVAFVPVRGRTLDRWLPIAAGWLWLRTRGQHEFRSAAPSIGATMSDRQEPEAAPLSLPEALKGCEILAVPLEGGESVGVFRDLARGTLTAVLAVRVRAFGLLAEADQERRLDRWGRVLAGLARSGSIVRRLCVLERTVPSDGDEMQRYLVEARDRDLPVEDAAFRSYEALLHTAGDVTQDHELFIGMQVDERRAASRGSRRERRRDLSSNAGGRAVVRELLDFASRLDPTDVVVDGVLSPRMLAGVVRLAFDPYGRERQNRLSLVQPELAGADPQAFGPVAADSGWDVYRTDGAIHRTYWVAQWPRLNVSPAFLSPLLLSAQVVRSVAITIEPVPPERARRAVEAAVTSEEADQQLRTERGFRTSARRQKQHQATLRREHELAEGHQEIRFAAFVTVSGRDRDDLERACSEVEQSAHQAYLDLQPLWGQQDVGFTQGALPIGRGLRPSLPLGGS
jgi:hypothetical protein